MAVHLHRTVAFPSRLDQSSLDEN